MDIQEQVIREWFFRLPKGYAEPPYTEEELTVLVETIHDLGLSIDFLEHNENDLQEDTEVIQEESETDDLVDLFNALGGLPKIGQFDVLAKYTTDHYKTELSDILKLFPSGVNVIDDFTKYVSPSDYRNQGEAKEAAIVAWAEENGVPASHVEGSTGKGVDIYLDYKPIEVKSSNKTINTLLQTSFFKNEAEKFYIFATSQGGNAIKLVIVSSQLLYRLSLGEDIYDELQSGQGSKRLADQIAKGLSEVDFASQISAALISGEAPEGTQKSFKVGKNINIRFLIFIEPTGKFD